MTSFFYIRVALGGMVCKRFSLRMRKMCYYSVMFGYVRPFTADLKLREHECFRAYYCGLCHELKKRHGAFTSLFLSYDTTFLAMLLASTEAEDECFVSCRCPGRSGCGKRVQRNRALVFAADMNVLLSYYKCADNWADERRLLGLLGKWVLAAAFRRVQKAHPTLCGKIAAQMDALRSLEKGRNACPDAACAPFAALMAAMGRAFAENDCVDDAAKQLAPLDWLLYNLGRWIYLLDAWDDREKDEKSASFNPFLLAQTTREDAAFLIYLSLNEACNALDLLELRRNENILRNILDMGCRNKTAEVLETGKGTAIGSI